MSDNSNQSDRNMKNKYRFIVTVLILIAVILTNFSSLMFGNYLASRGIYFTKVSTDVEKSSQLMRDTSKYEALFLVRDTLLKKYDGKIDDNVLLEGAINGMTNSLGDPYTKYFNDSEFEKLMKESQGSLKGVGVQIGSIENKIVIISPIKDSPADRAGLKSGDIIEKVDNVSYSGEQIDKAISHIASQSKSDVTLTIKRKGVKDFNVTMTKEIVKIQSIEGEMLSSDIGYIKINTFMNDNTAADFQNKIKELKKKGMKGLVIDLRNNGGGLLSQAVGVASQFIPKDKVITYTIDKYNNKNESLSLGGEAEGMPLVLLVDNGSASASEVVTGALRDYKAATIVGKTTFGKGIVQQPFKLKDKIGGLKITTSKYYTPNGENIHKKGIKPDFDVNISKDINDKDYDKKNDEQLNFAKEKLQEKLK